jgi:hypothetical protein
VFNFLGEVMNERIKELALQAGINSPDRFKLTVNHMATFRLEKFAELVRADEREGCAKLCMAVPRTGAYFARLIRARGTT